MSTPPAFVLPAGLEIDLGEMLSIGYEGDVTIEQSFGRPLGDVYAAGDLVIRLDEISGSLRAGGKLVLEGKVDADTVHGAEVHIGNVEVKCRAISADQRIVIGAAKLAVDIIIAPEIIFDPKASGRVTVIESHNEPGPTKIKGGFSLKEYEEVVGDPSQFLAERGINSLGEPTSPPSRHVSNPDSTPDDGAARPVTDPSSSKIPERGSKKASAATPPPAPQAQEPAPPPEEDVSDPLSLSVDDLEPVAEPEPEDELHPKLMDAVKRIAACYEGKETPPAVAQLRELVESRDYDRLRENITEVWNGLLGFHQKKGIRPHHQVTHAFNVIHGLVQQT